LISTYKINQDFTECSCAFENRVNKEFCQDDCTFPLRIFFFTITFGAFVAGTGMISVINFKHPKVGCKTMIELGAYAKDLVEKY